MHLRRTLFVAALGLELSLTSVAMATDKSHRYASTPADSGDILTTEPPLRRCKRREKERGGEGEEKGGKRNTAFYMRDFVSDWLFSRECWSLIGWCHGRCKIGRWENRWVRWLLSQDRLIFVRAAQEQKIST